MNPTAQQYHNLTRVFSALCLFFLPGNPVVAGNRADVRTGLDVLEAEAFARLKGRHIGLITNRTGIDRAGSSNIEVFRKAPDLKLVALFSPEHGLWSNVDHKVSSTVDAATGLPIFSLYGETRRPTREMMQGIDLLIFDIQDVGVRFYTYITTMAYAMEEAAKAGIRFMVLDRPNPINGIDVEGPILDPERLSFTGYFSLPVRHGMTVGELAELFNQENKLGVDLEVVKMQGWDRRYWFDDFDLPWVNPSPNIRSLRQATLYPAIGLLESANLSVGRGTEMPFEVVGAPWINATRLSSLLNSRKIPGVKVQAFHFTPHADRYEGKRCHGVKIEVTDRTRFRAVACGLEMARALCQLYPKHFESEKLVNLVGTQDVVRLIKERRPLLEIYDAYLPRLEEFLTLRAKYLNY